MSPETSRSRLGQFIERPAFQRGILLLIVINAAILGMQTSAALVARWESAEAQEGLAAFFERRAPHWLVN